jgi:hypothetical protein
MSRRSIVSKAQTSPTHNPRLATRLGQSLSKQNLLRTARNIGPILVALTFATAANAQGTMDFSGAQTLMGTFNWRNDYAGIEQWSRFIREGNYCYHTQLHAQHERFAKTWDNNLRQQGFDKAFTDKCIVG